MFVLAEFDISSGEGAWLCASGSGQQDTYAASPRSWRGGVKEQQAPGGFKQERRMADSRAV